MNNNIITSFDIVFDVKEKQQRKSLINRLFGCIAPKKRISTKVMDNLKKLSAAIERDERSSINVVRVLDSEFNFEALSTLGLFLSKKRSEKEYNLMRDFEILNNILSSLVYDEPKRKNVEIEITIEIPKPKTLKKVTTYEQIHILERWVKIGYKMYRRHFNVWTGNSYIIVDGDVYDIKTNRYGVEYLA